MKTYTDTIRSYSGDLLAAHNHCLEAIKHQLGSDAVKRVPATVPALSAIQATLESNINAIGARLKELGGATTGGQLKEALTTITGFFTGLYGQARPTEASRDLRDDYTALSFLIAATSMLHTTALALHDERTATMVVGMLPPLASHVMVLTGLIPTVVLIELADEHPSLDRVTGQKAVEGIYGAWRSASSSGGDATSVRDPRD